MILILTPYSFNPLHPRLEYIEKYLIKNNYIVKKYNLNCSNRIINKLNWLSLTFFQIPAFFKSFKYLLKYRNDIEVVYIQDLQYLHISILVKLFGKKVIYDTLDNNVELNFYHLSNRFSIFKKLSFVKSVISFIEKKMSKYFCDEVIVNSKALVEYFKPIQTNLIYYTSPFENKFKINFDNPRAFLYLGAFVNMKGAEIILDFVEKYNQKLFIFGTINNKEKNIVNKIELLKKRGIVFFTDRLPSKLLEIKITEMLKYYKLIGFSLIKDIHYSYSTQEANKDIDYLAMGIPIIANHRKPTEEKVKAGCGVFIEDNKNIEKLLKDNEFYKNISKNCINYYNKNYAQSIFEEKLLKVVKNV